MTQRLLSILRTHDDREIPAAGKYMIDPRTPPSSSSAATS